MKKIILLIIVLLLGSSGYFAYTHFFETEHSSDIVLYGNVDQRQVELAFTDAERVAEVFVEEGDFVTQGQILATLETDRLETRIDVAQAQLEAAQAMSDKLRNGARPEEIDQARASVQAAQAQLDFAESQYSRINDIYSSNAVSQSDYEQALQHYNVAKAQYELQQKNLELILLGAREEDLAAAQANVMQAQGILDELNTILEDAQLRSPLDSVVNRRLLEVGDMANPQRAAFSLAVLSPKWIRAYISEVDLGHISQGMTANIYIDSFPNEPLVGTVGFISSVAEFTPRAVQTEDLRTALVYEVRIYVEDQDNVLRLGMPATVRF